MKPLVMTVGIHEFTAKSNPKYGGTPPGQDEAHQLFLKSEGLVETNVVIRQAIRAKTVPIKTFAIMLLREFDLEQITSEAERNVRALRAARFKSANGNVIV